jgi:hypothetical protein
VKTLSNEAVLQILEQYDRGGHVQPSPRPGHLRIHDMNNDVFWAMEKMGGLESACELLGVTLDEANKWIDHHYVPEPFVTLVSNHTRYSKWALQEPTFYVSDGTDYWPHIPSEHELTRPQGMGLYLKKPNRHTAEFAAW